MQDTLEAAVTQFTGEAQRMRFAGRTDSGVHARGQVATLDTSTRHEPARWVALVRVVLFTGKGGVGKTTIAAALGVLSHFSQIARGVIDLRDALWAVRCAAEMRRNFRALVGSGACGDDARTLDVHIGVNTGNSLNLSGLKFLALGV